MRRKEMTILDHRPDVFLGGKPQKEKEELAKELMGTNIASCQNNGRLTYVFVAIDHIGVLEA